MDVQSILFPSWNLEWGFFPNLSCFKEVELLAALIHGWYNGCMDGRGHNAGTIYTIGHSTLSRTEFLKTIAHMDVVVDVRSHPSSKIAPQFNTENLANWLREDGKSYLRLPSLGGWGPKYKDLTWQRAMDYGDQGLLGYLCQNFPRHRVSKRAQTTTGWKLQGFADFSLWMLEEEFYRGLSQLIDLVRSDKGICILGGSMIYWRCHRSMIADALCYLGWNVAHLQPRLMWHDAIARDRLNRYSPRFFEACDAHPQLFAPDEQSLKCIPNLPLNNPLLKPCLKPTK